MWLVGVFLVACLLLVLLQGSRPGKDDSSGMVGLEGIAEETFSQEGMVFVRGELWKATAERGIIQKGEKILVSEVMPGLKLLVRSGKDPAEA